MAPSTLPDTTPAGHVFSNIQVSGSSRNHFGNVHYTIQESVPISQDALLALAGPLNISTAAQGLLLVSSRLIADLQLALPTASETPLRSCVETFRDLIRALLLESALASASSQRAALLSATDLVVTVSEAVVLLSELEGSVRSFLERRSATSQSLGESPATIPADWGLITHRLCAVNGILVRYFQVLRCESLAEAMRIATEVRSKVAVHCRQHDLLPTLSEIPANGSVIPCTGTHDDDWATETRTELLSISTEPIIRPELAYLNQTDGDVTEPESTAPALFRRDFEEVLFRTAVYSRNKDRRESLTSSRSTMPTYAPSVFSNLTLADASVLSVLHLPVKLGDLTNSSDYLQAADNEAGTSPGDPSLSMGVLGIRDQLLPKNGFVSHPPCSSANERPNGRIQSISFSPRVQFHATWSNEEYDRGGIDAEGYHLTPMLAKQIKHEVNTFKMEMEVHEESTLYTHFY